MIALPTTCVLFFDLHESLLQKLCRVCVSCKKHIPTHSGPPAFSFADARSSSLRAGRVPDQAEVLALKFHGAPRQASSDCPAPTTEQLSKTVASRENPRCHLTKSRAISAHRSRHEHAPLFPRLKKNSRRDRTAAVFHLVKLRHIKQEATRRLCDRHDIIVQHRISSRSTGDDGCTLDQAGIYGAIRRETLGGNARQIRKADDDTIGLLHLKIVRHLFLVNRAFEIVRVFDCRLRIASKHNCYTKHSSGSPHNHVPFTSLTISAMLFAAPRFEGLQVSPVGSGETSHEVEASVHLSRHGLPPRFEKRRMPPMLRYFDS